MPAALSKKEIAGVLEEIAVLLELQGELAMVSARKNLLDTMGDFVRSSDPKTANANALKAQIARDVAAVRAYFDTHLISAHDR